MANRGFRLLQQRGVTFERNVSTSKSARRRRRVLRRKFCPGADFLFDFVRGFLSAFCITRADNHGLAGLCPAQGQTRSLPGQCLRERRSFGRMGLCSRELRFEASASLVNATGSLDLDSRISSVALGRDASRFQNQRLKIFGAGVLSGSGASFARDVFFHQSSAVVVGAGVQAELRKIAIQLHPRNLDVVDGAGQQNSRKRVNFEMFGKRGAGARQSLMEKQSVLMHESERDEFSEAASFAAEFRATAEAD